MMGIRIPVVRLSIERVSSGEKDAGPIGETVGLGLFVFCTLTMLMGNVAGLDDGALAALRVGFAAATAVTLLASSVFDTRFHPVFRGLALAVGACIACTLVAAALFGVGYMQPGVPRTAASAVLGAVLGSSAAVLVLYWSITFARMETHDIVTGSAVASAVGFTLFACCLWLLPHQATHAISCLLPLGNIYLLRNRVTNRLPDVELRDTLYFAELKIDRIAFAAKIIPAMAAFGFSLGVLATHACKNPVPFGQPEFVGITLVAAIVCIAAMFGASAWIKRSDVSFNQVFRLLVPLVAALALPMPFASAGVPSFAEVATLCDLVLCAALAWAFLANISQDYRLSPLFVCGLDIGSLIAGMALTAPVLAGAAAFTAGVLDPAALNLSTCLFAFIIVSGFFPRGIDIHAIVSRSFIPEKLRGSDVPNDKDDEGNADANARGRAEAGAPAGRKAAGRGGAAGEAAGAFENAADAPLDAEAPRKGKFLRRCQQVADTYLLSRREADVLVLLAKGRNVGFIKDQLCISEGTAKTHVHHVYKKLNIHSQQELIALVDTVDAG